MTNETLSTVLLFERSSGRRCRGVTILASLIWVHYAPVSNEDFENYPSTATHSSIHPKLSSASRPRGLSKASTLSIKRSRRQQSPVLTLLPRQESAEQHMVTVDFLNGLGLLVNQSADSRCRRAGGSQTSRFRFLTSCRSMNSSLSPLPPG